MTNDDIAATLERVADLLEFQGADSFRTRAYRNAARAIEKAAPVLADCVAQGIPLTTIDGIGKSVAEKCEELVRTGRLSQLEQLLEEIPATVLDLLRVPKLGPKKAAVLYQQLGIADLAALRAACQAGKVRDLPGFGAKTEQTILAGIDIAAAARQQVYWCDAEPIVASFRDFLAAAPGVTQCEAVGSFRRGDETVETLEVMLAATDTTHALDRCAQFPGISSIDARTAETLSGQLDCGIRLLVRSVPREQWGHALLWSTGSDRHRQELIRRASDRGWTWSEQGLAGPDAPLDRIEDEAALYAALGLVWIPPELRRGGNELELAARNALPDLIERGDLRGDLHMHTTATDGSASIADMAAAARARGLQYIAITDHSRRVAMANGLTPERALAQWAEIDQVNASGDGTFWIFKGIECDILEDATLDLPDAVLAQADWVLASVHYGQQQSREQITDRILTALRNPHVNGIAHPTGRIISRRQPYAVDFEAVLQAASEFGKVLELNANPARLDLHAEHCAAAQAREIPLVIDSDAHSPQGMDVLRYGILQARRGGLSAADVLNTLPLQQIRQRLQRD